MATRSKRSVELRWLLVDLGRAGKDDLVTNVRALHTRRLPLAKLSVNVSEDGTRALVKVANPLPDVRPGGPVLRIFTEKDHHEALALVTDPAWAPPDEQAR